ncbi:MAG: hypothetical protein ACP5E5_09305 [Acidobacteriaceae bacterium]
MVQDAAGYQDMLARLEKLEAVAAIRTGLQDLEDGKARPARKALKDLERTWTPALKLPKRLWLTQRMICGFRKRIDSSPGAAERW